MHQRKGPSSPPSIPSQWTNKFVLKKMRVSSIEAPLDTITFSQENIGKLLTQLFYASGRKLFSSLSKSNAYEAQKFPEWFRLDLGQSLVSWAAAFFDQHIRKYFLRPDIKVHLMPNPYSQREIFTNKWISLSEQQKEEIITESINTVDTLSASVFEPLSKARLSKADFSSNAFENMVRCLLSAQHNSSIKDIGELKRIVATNIISKISNTQPAKLIFLFTAGPLKDFFRIEFVFISQIVKKIKALCTAEFQQIGGQARKKKKTATRFGLEFCLSLEMIETLSQRLTVKSPESLSAPPKKPESENQGKNESNSQGEQQKELISNQQVSNPSVSISQVSNTIVSNPLELPEGVEPIDSSEISGVRQIKSSPDHVEVSLDLSFPDQVKSLLQTNRDDPNFVFLKQWNLDSAPGEQPSTEEVKGLSIPSLPPRIEDPAVESLVAGQVDLRSRLRPKNEENSNHTGGVNTKKRKSKAAPTKRDPPPRSPSPASPILRKDPSAREDSTPPERDSSEKKTNERARSAKTDAEPEEPQPVDTPRVDSALPSPRIESVLPAPRVESILPAPTAPSIVPAPSPCTEKKKVPRLKRVVNPPKKPGLVATKPARPEVPKKPQGNVVRPTGPIVTVVPGPTGGVRRHLSWNSDEEGKRPVEARSTSELNETQSEKDSCSESAVYVEPSIRKTEPVSLRERINLVKPGFKIDEFVAPPPSLIERVDLAFFRALEAQIVRITDALIANAELTEESRRLVKERLVSVVERTFEGAVELYDFGSNATKLITPFSDIDLGLKHKTTNNIFPAMAINMLSCLSDNLNGLAFVEKTTAILSATIPVVKIEADPSVPFEDLQCFPRPISVKCDIIVSIDEGYKVEHTSTRTTKYVVDASKQYPTFFRNVLLAKYMLNCLNMASSYRGGLNSYGLCLFYIAFLKSSHYEKVKNLGLCLFKFLEFVASFDAVNLGIFISLQSKSTISRSWYQGQDLGQLLVMDPTDFAHKNVTSTCNIFPTIQSLFGDIAKQLIEIRDRTFFQASEEELKNGAVDNVIERVLATELKSEGDLEELLLFQALSLKPI